MKYIFYIASSALYFGRGERERQEGNLVTFGKRRGEMKKKVVDKTC